MQTLTAGLCLATIPDSLYTSPIKLAVLAVVGFGFLALAPRINQDAFRLRVINRPLWAIGYLSVGTVGLLLWVLIPSFTVGLILMLVCWAVVFFSYFFYRNGRVDADARINPLHLLGLNVSLGAAAGSSEDKVRSHLRLYGVDNRAVLLSEEQVADKKFVHQYNQTQDFLFDVTVKRASHVELITDGKKSRLTYIIDGVRSDQPPPPPRCAAEIMDYIEHLSTLDVREGQKARHQKISVDIGGEQVDIDVAIKNDSSGHRRMKLQVVRELIRTDLDALGLEESTRDVLIETLHKPGLLIISGPADSGVTSTLYSLLRKQDPYMKMLMTVEAKTPSELENVTHNHYESLADMPNVVNSTLRREPDVVLIDRCDDPDSAQLLSSYAAEHTVLIGERANDALQGLARWVKTVGQLEQAVRHLDGVLCQVLIRRLCPSCRVAYQPDPALLKKLRLPPDYGHQFYRPPLAEEKPVDKKGTLIPCQTCMDVGYFGRTGIFEFLEMSDEIRQALLQKASLTQIRGLARQQNMRSMQENAIRKVLRGETSLQEVSRVMKQLKGDK